MPRYGRRSRKAASTFDSGTSRSSSKTMGSGSTKRDGRSSLDSIWILESMYCFGRLDQQFFQNRMKLQKVVELDLHDPKAETVLFAKNTFVSTEEADAFLALNAVCNYLVCPIFCTSLIVSVARLDERIRGLKAS
jgi:hypothetical protein